MSADKKHLEQLKTFFYEEYGLSLTDEEVFECYESLYYLAKAIIRYYRINKGGEE